MDLGLGGARAVVTGGSRGIGLATARALAREGAQVALLGRDRELLQRRAGEINQAFSIPATTSAFAVVVDTQDDASVRAGIKEAADRMGAITVVVNAAAPRTAATAQPGLDGLDEADFLLNLDTKVLGYARVVRAARPHLVNSGGSVVNVSGINARRTGSITGSVRNIGVVALTKNLADELGPYGVSVTCVHPGVTVTERFEGDRSYAHVAAQNTLGRAITAAEVAEVIAFLSSPLAAIANGNVVTLDGGSSGPIWA